VTIMAKKTFVKVGGRDISVQGRLIRFARLDGEKFTFPVDPEGLLNSLRKCGTRIDLFTFLQKLPETSPKYAYPMEWDNLAILPVSTFDHWWNHQIRSYPRNRARQAERKGVVVREVPFDDALLQGICEIYNESPVRQGRRFPHYGITHERAREYAGTFLDRSIFIGAFLGDQMIGFVKLVVDETCTHACAIHILSKLEHRDKAPTNALIAQAVRSCADRGISYLVYENFSYGKKQGDSLSHFKEVNGFERVNLPRYYIPLTAIGRVALRLGMHHRFIDYFPESLMARLRAFRNAWYTRRPQTFTDAS
jgi:hypothetical protein